MPLDRRGLYCEICQKAGKKGTWSTQPARVVRLRNADDHVDSKDHVESVKLTKTQPQLGFGPPASKDREVFSALVAKAECVYWLCKEEVANLKFASLQDLVEHLGVRIQERFTQKNAQYNSRSVSQSQHSQLSPAHPQHPASAPQADG